MTAKLYNLSNGVRVIIDEVPHTQTAAIGMYFTVGSRFETKKNNGVAHFLEHMMFKGTKRRGVGQVHKEAEDMGAQLNAFTSHDSTCFHITGLASDLPAMIDILSDMVCHATLPAEEIEKEKGAVLAEIRESKGDLERSIFLEALDAAYPRQPMGFSTLGPEKNIRSMSRNTLQKFKDNHYHAGNLIVSIAGNIKAEDILPALEENLRDLPLSASSSFKKVVYKGNSSHHPVKSEHLHLVLQFNSCAQDDPHSLPAAMLGNILGDGPSSRFFQEIREKRGLAYDVTAANDSDIDHGVFQVYLQSSRKDMRTAIPVICDEIRKAMNEGFSMEEVKRAKASWRTSFAIVADSMESRMERSAEELHLFGQIYSIEERLREIDEKVTPESVRIAAKKIFSCPPSIVTIGPGPRLVTPSEISRRISL